MALGVCVLSSESAPRGGRCQDHGWVDAGFQNSRSRLFWGSPQNWERSDFKFELLKYFFILCFLVCLFFFSGSSRSQFLRGGHSVAGRRRVDLQALQLFQKHLVGLTSTMANCAWPPWLRKAGFDDSCICIWSFSN